MSDVNKEQARREAVENVGNRPPTEGENRVQAAMRRYLGAEVFHEVHPPEKAKGKAEEKGRKPGEDTGQEPAAESEDQN